MTHRTQPVTTKPFPTSFTLTLTAKNRDGSEAVIQLDDYGVLREAFDHLEDMAEQQGWFTQVPEKT
jgi:hypothetical protein